MVRRKLLIADGNEEFRYALAALLPEEYQIRECGSGPEALSTLRSFQPDILVLDLMLPGLDGISLLHTAASEGIRPAVLATTRFNTEYITESVDRLGISYVLVKPCNVPATAERILEMKQPIHSPGASSADPRIRISELLISLGISTKLRGYAYLREAILMMSEHPDQSMTKELYPAVGALFGSSRQQVEHCIRTAIGKAWHRRDDRIWLRYFQAGAGGIPPRPSNAVFISRLANSLSIPRDR